MIEKRMYVSPEGEVVEATSHEFVTQLKNAGYVRATPEAPTQEVEQTEEVAVEQDVTPEVVETPEATNVDEALNNTIRSRRDR